MSNNGLSVKESECLKCILDIVVELHSHIILSRFYLLLDSMRLRNTPIPKSHECWYCFDDNPSYSHQCEDCDAALIPTRDKNRKQIEWTIFSFRSICSVLERSISSQFSRAMEVFDTQDRVAIRLYNGHIKHLLVRHPQHEETLYSIKEGYLAPRTIPWDTANEMDRMSLFRFVEENLDSCEETSGKSNLLERGGGSNLD